MTDEDKLDFMLYYVFYVPVMCGLWFLFILGTGFIIFLVTLAIASIAGWL